MNTTQQWLKWMACQAGCNTKSGNDHLWSCDDVAALIKAVRNEALEAAAKKADEAASYWSSMDEEQKQEHSDTNSDFGDDPYQELADEGEDIARSIREMEHL